jgi:hypothetical protein
MQRLIWKLAVTGWKSVFVNKGFTKRIVELTKDESDVILEYLFKVFSPSLISLPLLHFNFIYACTDVLEILVGISEP